MKYGSILFTILFLVNYSQLKASPIQDLESLKAAAKSYALTKTNQHLDGKTEVQVGNIDSRLRLTPCSGDLIAFTPPGSRLQGNTTIGIRCDGPRVWSIYIPVKISIYQQAIVATNKLARGQMIGASDVELEQVDVSRVRGKFFSDKAQLIGTKLKTSVQMNQVIDSAIVCLICKGDSVNITATGNTVSVSMAGIALNDGGLGDKIRVQNNASRKILDAIVTNSGTVKVDI